MDPADAGLAQLPQTVPECHAVITLLIERVKLLEERVNLDSNNSSKPLTLSPRNVSLAE